MGALHRTDERTRHRAPRRNVRGGPPDDVETMDLDGVPMYVARPDSASERTPIYLDIHGGALILLGGEICKFAAAGGALSRDMITWAIDYRMPPKFPYPAALDDCMAMYRRSLRGAGAGGHLRGRRFCRWEPCRSVTAPRRRTKVFCCRHGRAPFRLRWISLSRVTRPEPCRPHRCLHRLSDVRPICSTPTVMTLRTRTCRRCSAMSPRVSRRPSCSSGTRDHFLSNTVRMHRLLSPPALRPNCMSGRQCPTAGSEA